MNHLTIIQFFCFFAYVAYVWAKVGVLPSISESWYQLPQGQQNRFVIFAAGVGLPMWAYGMYPIKDEAQLLFALSGFWMFCISIASMFKVSKMVKLLHYMFSGFAIAFAHMGIYAQYHEFVTLGLTAIGCLPILLLRNRIWWLEVWIFTLIIARLFYY